MQAAEACRLREQSPQAVLRYAICEPGNRYTARRGGLPSPESRPLIQSILRPWCVPSFSLLGARQARFLGGNAFPRKYVGPAGKVPGMYEKSLDLLCPCGDDCAGQMSVYSVNFHGG